MRSALVGLMLLLSGLPGARAAGAAEASLLATLTAKENEVWAAFQRKDAAAFKALVSDDFVQVDLAGVTTAGQQVASMADYAITDFTLSDFRLVKASPATVVLLYHGVARYTYKGQAGSQEMNTSTVWTRRKGHWVACFHEETPPPPAALH